MEGDRAATQRKNHDFYLLVTSGGESGAHEKCSQNEALRQPQDREFGFRRKSHWDSGLAAMAIDGFAMRGNPILRSYAVGLTKVRPKVCPASMAAA